MHAKREHPAEGELRAWADREAGARRFRIVLHLWRCGACRERLHAIRSERARVAALLQRLAPAVDAAEAWARLRIRSAGGPRRRAASPLALAAAGLLSAALAAALLLPAREPAPADAAERVRQLQARTGARITRDICCADHDGGGPADDGLFTLSLPGEAVAAVVVYEDLDGSGSFSPGDLARYVSSEP